MNKQRGRLPEYKNPALVFVYGSLKKGFRNNKVLGDSKYVGTFKTTTKFKMLDLGYYPALMLDDVGGNVVLGELYEVSGDTFERLDQLEGYPHMYDRDIITLSNGSKAWVYFMKKDNYNATADLVEPNKGGLLIWTEKPLQNRRTI